MQPIYTEANIVGSRRLELTGGVYGGHAIATAAHSQGLRHVVTQTLLCLFTCVHRARAYRRSMRARGGDQLK
jgi:hypothetical protein